MARRFSWRGAVLDDLGIGRTAFWLAGIPSALAILTVMPEGIPIVRGFGLWVMASVVATGMLGLVLLASASIRARVAVPPRLMPLVVLVTMLLAGAARGVGVVLVFRLVEVDDRATAAGRVISSALIFTVWLVLIGGFLSSLAAYRAARQALLDEIVMRELQMRLFDESRATGMRDDTAARMSETTDMVRDILESAEMGDPDEYARISLLLHRAIDERIRPLVHEMWFEPRPEFDAPASTREFLRKAYLTRVPLTWALALYAFIAASGAVVTVGWRLGIEAAVIEWGTFALILLGERALRSSPGLLSRSLTILLLLVLPLLLAWVALGSRMEIRIPFFALLAIMVTAPILTLTCCAAQAVLDERGPSLQELQRRLERDDWAEQLETLEVRAAENSMASVIHNTVQARLLAAALQLETAALTNDQRRAETALQDARTALDSARVPEVPASNATAQRLRSISEAWQGILDVRVELDDAVPAGPSTRLALDAIEECVANAARHASATVVEVSLRSEREGLAILVRDDGSPLAAERGSGMGTDWMLSITAGRMRRSRTADGRNEVRLTITPTV